MGVKKFYRPILGYDGEMIDGGGSAGAVESVNGQTGAVTLTASDVSALPDTYTPPAGVAVADAVDETDVVAQFNALLASLRTAGFISD